MEKSLSVWSEDETLKFEVGLVRNGKNFHAIQKEVIKNLFFKLLIFLFIIIVILLYYLYYSIGIVFILNLL